MRKIKKMVYSFVHLAAASLITFSLPASAQVTDATDTVSFNPLRPQNSYNRYGVNYNDGGFNFSIPIISVGNGAFPNNLTIGLSYNSALRVQNWRLSGIVQIITTPKGQLSDDWGYPYAGTRMAEYSVIYPGENAVFAKADSYDFAEKVSLGNDLDAPDNSLNDTNFSRLVFQSRMGDNVTVYPQSMIYSEFGPTQKSSMISADGSSYTGTNLSGGYLITNNRGLAILIENRSDVGGGRHVTKICAFNMSNIYVGANASCAASHLVAEIETADLGDGHLSEEVTAVTLPDGGQYNFEYSAFEGIIRASSDAIYPARKRYHLTCVKAPGKSTCGIQNEYELCDGPGNYGSRDYDLDWNGSRDRVKRQILGDGSSVNYTFTPTTGTSPYQRPCRMVSSVTEVVGQEQRTISIETLYGNIRKSSDGLSRATQYEWTGANDAVPNFMYGTDGLIKAATYPTGLKKENFYDGRGNVTEQRTTAVDNSTLSVKATYPTSCANFRICNRLVSRTDANGNTTYYAYDSSHGGLVKKLGPSPSSGAARPLTLHTYVSKYAYVKNSSGSLVPAPSPIWVPSTVTECSASATSTISNASCLSSAPKRVTTYEYGANGTADNLLLHGMAVTADGTTLRTCYGYDEWGDKISETSPRAGLAMCQ